MSLIGKNLSRCAGIGCQLDSRVRGNDAAFDRAGKLA